MPHVRRIGWNFSCNNRSCFQIPSFASLALASAVGFAVFLGVGKVSPNPLLLDPLKVIFIISAALPNLFACWLYSISYCFLVRMKDGLKHWLEVILKPAFRGNLRVDFQRLSAITIIEYLFDWQGLQQFLKLGAETLPLTNILGLDRSLPTKRETTSTTARSFFGLIGQCLEKRLYVSKFK